MRLDKERDRTRSVTHSLRLARPFVEKYFIIYNHTNINHLLADRPGLSSETGIMVRGFNVGNRPSRLLGSGRVSGKKKLSGEKVDYGDATEKLHLLLRVPLIFVLWKKDEEFESQVHLILGKSIEEQMNMEDVLQTLLSTD